MPRKENIEDFNLLLAEWDGCEAFLNKMPLTGEAHFNIGLARPGTTTFDHSQGKGAVGITLFYCGYIAGPTRWSNCKVRCRKRTFRNEHWAKSQDIEGYELYDEGAMFSIHCYENMTFGDNKLHVPSPT